MPVSRDEILGGTAGYLQLETSVGNLGNSIAFQDGSGNVGFGTITPGARIHSVGIDSTGSNFSFIASSSSSDLFQIRNNGYFTIGSVITSTSQVKKGLFILDKDVYSNPLTTGDQNIVIGNFNVGFSLTTAQYCTLIGPYAGKSITTGSSNTAIGANTLNSLVTEVGNVAVGNDALNIQTGAAGTAIGFNSGGNWTGTGGTFLGNTAGIRFTGGNTITAVGYYAGERLNPSGSYGGCTYVGNQVESNDTTEAVFGGRGLNKFYLGQGKFAEDADDTATDYVLSIPSVDATGNGMGRTASTNGSSLYDFIVGASRSTGSGVGGKLKFGVTPAGGAGSTLNSYQYPVIINGDGTIQMPLLPTSSVGLAPGTLWSDAGTLKIV